VRIISILLVFAVLFTSSLSTVAFAQTSYDINIPTGAGQILSPYSWQNEKDGSTTGDIEVLIGDTIVWKNGDTEFHDITSGSEDNGSDGIFGSKPFGPGNSFTYKFSEMGVFPYYCTLHPQIMSGVVNVVKDLGSVHSISNVASGYSDDGLGYEVKYILDTDLEENVFIDTTENALTFKISGDTENEQIIIILPTELIENPNTVWIDGVMTDFEIDTTSSGIKLTIPIEPYSDEIKIMGTSVIPEFGLMTLTILGVSVVSMIVLSQRFKLKI
jgi:predicted secreted protein with PEFG-CTERM motif